MVSLGTMALDDGAGIDFARLRRDRSARLLQAMADHGIDALVLGRDDNLRFATGARRLNLAGNRPFMPACVVVRDGGDMYVVNTWDDGVPDEIPHDHLIQLSVNPMDIVVALQKIAGLTGASTIGIDGISPLYRDLLAMTAPGARLVNADAGVAPGADTEVRRRDPLHPHRRRDRRVRHGGRGPRPGARGHGTFVARRVPGPGRRAGRLRARERRRILRHPDAGA